MGSPVRRRRPVCWVRDIMMTTRAATGSRVGSGALLLAHAACGGLRIRAGQQAGDSLKNRQNSKTTLAARRQRPATIRA